MDCPRCGSEIKDGMLFCEHCGEEIRIVQDFDPQLDEPVAGFEEPDAAEKEGAADVHRKEDGPKKRFTFQQKWILSVCFLLLTLSLMTVGGYSIRYFSAEYQYSKAQEYIEKKDYARAGPYARRAAQLDPDNVDYLLDVLYCMTEEAGEQAEALCRRIISLDGSCQAAYKRLISIYEEEKDYEKINELLLGCGDEGIVNQYPAYLAKPPEFSYKSGIYNETLSLKLLANTTGVIYYSTDGSKPDENSLVYASPIFLESGTYQIRAVFVNDYGIASEEAQETYYVDVTVPEAPEVTPESGEYNRPTLVTVSAGETCSVYYTTDGSAPTQDSTQYTGPFSMPVGTTHMRFICYSAAGVASEETSAAFTLRLHAALSMDAARNKLLIELMGAGVIQNMSGTVKTGTGHNVYNYRYAVTIEDTDYYLYREYYEDDAGNRAGTGTDYVVSVMDGQCYKVVQAKQEAVRKADEPEEASPWDSLMLQDINSGIEPE